MTKKQFIQQAVIAMAAKVIGTNGITDNSDWCNMVQEAENLADIMEKEGHLNK